MRRPHLLALIALGCAGTPPRPAPSVDPERAATIARLCEPLPSRAFDCVVGWPASTAPTRRDAVETASEGAAWANVEGVRAFATCADRPNEDGPVAHVISILVDTAIATPQSVAERLPVRTRWEEACADPTSDCAGYFARADGDRLVLTHRVQRPMPTDDDVAHLTCAAVADGAREAHTLLDGDGPLVRELRPDASGVAIVRRRPGGRGGVERTHLTWTELELDAMDERTEHEADVRVASMGRAMDPEEVDVTNETALDLQVHARQRQVGRAPSADGFHALARLAQRGFEAHPSRPDLGYLAVVAAVQAHDGDIAHAVLAALTATIGDESFVPDLGMLVEATFDDAAALAARFRTRVPELSEAEASTMAAALAAELAAHPLAPDAAFSDVFAALRAVAAASHAHLAPRAPLTLTPARDAGWALQALAGGNATQAVVACSEADLPFAIGTHASRTSLNVAFASFGHCTAYRSHVAVRFETGAAAATVLSTARGATRLWIEAGGALVGLGGTLDASGALHVDAASPSLTHGDLARAQREVALPLDALGTRTFPPPTLAMPIPEARRDAVVSATVGIEGVECARSASGVSCSLESYESVERLADAAFAAFAAR